MTYTHIQLHTYITYTYIYNYIHIHTHMDICITSKNKEYHIVRKQKECIESLKVFKNIFININEIHTF